nr:MAG TPA: hypothetical protein [Caudoviricetes sp.]
MKRTLNAAGRADTSVKAWQRRKITSREHYTQKDVGKTIAVAKKSRKNIRGRYSSKRKENRLRVKNPTCTHNVVNLVV